MKRKEKVLALLRYFEFELVMRQRPYFVLMLGSEVDEELDCNLHI